MTKNFILFTWNEKSQDERVSILPFLSLWWFETKSVNIIHGF